MDRLAVRVFLLSLATVYIQGISHYCPTSYRVSVWRYRTYSYQCGCYSWIRCYGRTCYRAYIQKINSYTCCEGWKGSRCDIPICKPPCQNGAICISKDKCSCPSGYAGAQCQIQVCSAQTDCYPGTCQNSPIRCFCTPGFDGANCETILDGPGITRCRAFFSDINGASFQAECGPPGNPDKYTYHTNMRDIKNISIDLETVYTYPGDVPLKPYYLPVSRVGNVDSFARAILYNKEGDEIQNKRLNCDTRLSRETPFAAAECTNMTSVWPHAIGHDYRLEVVMYGKSGGYKDINSNERVDRRYYTGTLNNYTLIINFDVLDPHHCHVGPTENCTKNIPPIFTYERVMDPNITMDCYGWNDMGTGLLSYTYQIYKMGLSSQHMFEHSGAPIFTHRLNVLNLTSPLVSFVLPEPGRYSAVLTVEDRAGNTKKARSLILFDDSNKIAIRPNKTVTLQNAVQGPDYLWLTRFTKGSPTRMKALLAGVFYNPYHIEQSYLNETEQLNKPMETPPFNWGYEDIFGNLTTRSIPNYDCITGFDFAYGVDQDGGREVRNNPPAVVPLLPFSDTISFNHSLNDGYTVVVIVKAYDAVGDSVIQKVSIHVDSTPPIVASATFTKDVNATDQMETPYASRLEIVCSDGHGGIGEVEYVVSTSPGNVKVASAVARNFSLPGESASTCLTAGSNCYCTNVGDCYPKAVPVAINNCIFMDHLNEELKISYKVRNGGLLETAGPVDVIIQPLISVYGLNEYPTSTFFQAQNVSDEHVDVVWKYPKSCHKPSGVIIGEGENQYHVNHPKTSFSIVDLQPLTQYQLTLIVQYKAARSEPAMLTVKTRDEDCLGRGCTSPGFGTGAIVGIVIAMLLIILIVILVVFILLRRRANKPAVPAKVRHMGQTIKNRFTRNLENSYGDQSGGVQMSNSNLNNYRKSRGVLNVAYMAGLQGTEDDIYTYGELETDPGASWKHSQDKVVMGALITSGRFADVWKCSLNNNQTLAAKMNKPGATSEDIMLMKAKMNFLATSVPQHMNLVMLVGAVPSDSPVILLEFCDQTLKDWLKAQQKVTEDVEDNMTHFAVHIARAMKHLSDNHIIHRRLGARNVLLKNMNGQLIAKVNGFGPMNNDSEESSGEKERIPFKWMAPEQIGKPGQRRIYNEKTDVWTYGITVWEIFTKGSTPYKEHKHGEIKQVHDSGYRLPKPDYGPDQMYNEVVLECWAQKPKSRSSFADVVTKLEKLFGGSAGDQYYYEDVVKGKMNPDDFESSHNLYGGNV